MAKRLFRKGAILGTIGVIIVLALTYAFGEEGRGFQGYLMGMNLNEKKIFVNERTYFLNEKTALKNDEGAPIPIERFKRGSWVFIEAERSKDQKRTVIRTLYLLPKYINHKERSRYPFMQ